MTGDHHDPKDRPEEVRHLYEMTAEEKLILDGEMASFFSYLDELYLNDEDPEPEKRDRD